MNIQSVVDLMARKKRSGRMLAFGGTFSIKIIFKVPRLRRLSIYKRRDFYISGVCAGGSDLRNNLVINMSSISVGDLNNSREGSYCSIKVDEINGGLNYVLNWVTLKERKAEILGTVTKMILVNCLQELTEKGPMNSPILLLTRFSRRWQRCNQVGMCDKLRVVSMVERNIYHHLCHELCHL